MAEVSLLIEQGQLNKAAQLAQQHLKQNSNDVQMRFLQGVIAAEQRNYDQAIQIFTSLTQDFPSLPEPYNNLAVLYAAKGDSRKATQVLEQAIRTNPSYATAHENLGDLYARMASDAYAKALQLEGDRKAVQPKLALIKQIFSTSASARATPATAAPAPAVIAAAAPANVPAVPIAPPAVQKSEQIQEPPVPTAPKTEQTAVVAIEKAVAAWANAWKHQDMPAYYAAYSPNFKPQDSTLAAWKAERKERIVGKPTITLDVRDLKISVQGNNATASFRQFYASGGYKATTRKTLSLHQQGGKWLILREETGR